MPTPREVLSRLIEGVTARRWDELPALYADDAVVDHPFLLPAPGRLEGRAAVAAHFDLARRLPLEMRAENVRVHDTADPEVVVGEFDYRARNTATGAEFTIGNIFVLRVRDGLIAESRDYSNHAVIDAAFGRGHDVAEQLVARLRSTAPA
jgi:ketosteroid isomerase-like protein